MGHTALGAGRVVQQPLVRINQAIEDGTFYHNPTLLAAFAHAQAHQRAVHLMGLTSDGGVHAHINHLKALCTAAQAHAVQRLYVHAFTDGRDTPPQSAPQFLAAVEEHLQATTGQLASVTGRYYAMDRNQHWQRTHTAHDALVHGQGTRVHDWRQAIDHAYAQGITDEFLPPILLTDAGRLQPGDAVVCFNFRPDRSRQLIRTLLPHALHCVSMTTYDASLQGIVHPLWPSQPLTDTLGEVLSAQGKKQLRIAETEKYPHVTYFLSGGREAPFAAEERILCPSPPVPTYDQAPAMAAPAITQRLLPLLATQQFDFVCLNFANADMVGHTGAWDATVQACQTVDQCTAQVVAEALKNDYIAWIVADHGNADQMRDEQGRPHTAHTPHPVPSILVHPKAAGTTLRPGRLADVAPTILQCMGLRAPAAMQGKVLTDVQF